MIVTIVVSVLGIIVSILYLKSSKDYRSLWNDNVTLTDHLKEIVTKHHALCNKHNEKMDISFVSVHRPNFTPEEMFQAMKDGKSPREFAKEMIERDRKDK